ncbi:MAG: ABC transporter substrate-binding protein [Thermomicrobiales bacterium]
MRNDITFADGRAIKAEDVAASFARTLTPATAGGDVTALAGVSQLAGIEGAEEVLAGHRESLSGIQVSDAVNMIFTLTAPDSAFPEKLASIPASVVDTTGSGHVSANATGHFRLDGPASSDILTMTNQEYRYKGNSTVKELSFLLGASAANPGNLLQAGKIDIATGLTADEAALLVDPANSLDSLNVVATPEFSLLYLALDPTRAPLDDQNIRRAIQIGFPWDRLVAAAGASVDRAQGVIAPGMLGRDWPAVIPAYDLELARHAIAQSRYGTPERVPPIPIYTGQTSLSDPLRNVGVALQEWLGQHLGLSIEPVSVAWGDFIGGLPAGRFPNYSLTWVADYPDPSAFLRVLFGSDSPDNYSGYRSAAFDALVSEALSTPDEASRITLYEQAQQLLIDDAVVMPISFDIGYTAYRNGIGGVPVTPIGLIGLESVSVS